MKTKSNQNKCVLAAIAAFMLTMPLQAKEAASPAATEPSGPRVQIALLLDTSGSMDGLIDQARTQMWEVVNTFISAKQDGKVPYVEVALYEYGNDGLESKTNWVRRILPLSRDLDEVSKQLFALKTNGGSEYCGAVIKDAANDLSWDASPDTYKAIFIAGNEPFTQGPVKALESCRAAATKGVIVNTIHCGDDATGQREGWKDGAVAADGKYMIIDSNQAVVRIDAPQDGEILKLNESLNSTYVAYGRLGTVNAEKQMAQDANAMRSAPSVAAQRVAAKSSANYHNSNWDLVDASKEKDFDLAKVPVEELPDEMKKMTPEERANHIKAKTEERAKLQSRILELNKERDAFVADKRKEMAEAGHDTLDAAVVKAVREQASKKKITFGK
ncbi:MAG: vWA domain-containing protein [Verrucomicrobiales bacterium]